MIKISAGCNFWGNRFSLQKTLRENVQIRSFSGPYQSECGKIRTRKISVFGHFSRSESSMITNNSIFHLQQVLLIFSTIIFLNL